MSNSTQMAILKSLPFSTTTSSSLAPINIITDLLSAQECEEIISSHTTLVPSNVTPGTKRTREVFQDERLARLVWERIEGLFNCDDGGREGKMDGVVVDEDGERWVVSGLNYLWRLCLYEKGGKFSPHQDGRRLESISRQSFMTLNIYLTTLPSSSGGSTRFFSSSPFSNPDLQASYYNQPIQGSAVLFRDHLWHDGEEVLEGRKYLLRTDVMFERILEFEEERVWGGLDDKERGRKALRVAEGLEDAGSSEEAVRWYKRAFKLWPEGQRGE